MSATPTTPSRAQASRLQQHSNERTNDHSNVRPFESFDSRKVSETPLPFLVCAQNPSLSNPDLPIPELKARLRYEVPGLNRHEQAVIAMHVAARHAVDPLALVILGSVTARRLAEIRSALRKQGWQPTRLGGRQFASPSPYIQVPMRWQLQKPAAGRPMRLPRPFGRLLSRVQNLANELITWRFRYHLRLSPACPTVSAAAIAVGGVHTELFPVLTPSATRRLRQRGFHPGQLSGWLRHTVIDWNRPRTILEADLKDAGFKPSIEARGHDGVYQGVPFDGRVLVLNL
jgi:hypothetical protein